MANRQNRRAWLKPKIHPRKFEWWMSDYFAPAEVDKYNRSFNEKMNEKLEQEQKVERYDQLMAANAKGQVVQMTASEFARMVAQIQLLDSIPREELRRAKERVRRERKQR